MYILFWCLSFLGDGRFKCKSITPQSHRESFSDFSSTTCYQYGIYHRIVTRTISTLNFNISRIIILLFSDLIDGNASRLLLCGGPHISGLFKGYYNIGPTTACIKVQGASSSVYLYEPKGTFWLRQILEKLKPNPTPHWHREWLGITSKMF